jgi:hypothetical protein
MASKQISGRELLVICAIALFFFGPALLLIAQFGVVVGLMLTAVIAVVLSVIAHLLVLIF